MTTELTKAAQRLDDFLSQFDENEQERILRYALDHVVPRLKPRALTQRPAAQTEREANATARAFSLATMGAEEFVRCNGLPTGNSDEFLMTGPDLTDEHATACVDHLKWVGECVAFDTDDGVLVRLGDFTLGSLS